MAPQTLDHTMNYLLMPNREAQREHQAKVSKRKPPNGLPRCLHSYGPETAEKRCRALGISRRQQDEFGVRSQNLAEAAMKQELLNKKITPYTLPDGSVVSKDDGIREGTTLEGVSQLNPVFRPGGTITAGNACPLNDGAAAIVVMVMILGPRNLAYNL